MLWFKILLSLLMAYGIVYSIVRARGWQPPIKPASNAVDVGIYTFLLMGIWIWL